MNQKPYNRVAIIGGGFAGTTLALFLKRAGLHAEIYEARSETDLDAGAFLYLAPNGVNVLKTLGLEPALEKHGFATTGITLYNRRGRIIGNLDNRADKTRYGAQGQVVKRGEVFKLLRDELQRQGIPIRFGKKLKTVEQTENRVRGLFKDGSAVDTDLLIGADGINSSTRSTIDATAPQPNYVGLVDTGGFTYLPHLKHLTGPQHMVFGSKAFFGYTVKPSGEVYWFSNVPWAKEPAREELNAISAEAWRRRLLELHAGDPYPILEIIRAAPAHDIGKWPSREMPALPLWHKGAVCIMGDAAHATSPSAGQGASMALEDAIVLAKCLRDSGSAEQAFVTFQSLRRARVESVIQQARRNGNSKIPNPVIGFVRDLLLPVFLRAGAKAAQQAHAYKVEWTERGV